MGIDSNDRSIRFACSNCQVRIKANPVNAGKKVKCPKCSTIVRIPKVESPEDADSNGPSTSNVSDEVPVVCSVCSTRIYAHVSKVGTSVECPDCFTSNLVSKPNQEAAKSKTVPVDDSDEYRLADDDSPATETDEVAIVCELCQTRMYAPSIMIGRTMRCPDCNTANIIAIKTEPIKKSRTPSLEQPSAFDVGPAASMPQMKHEADDAIAVAEERIRRREEETPEPPKRPFLSAFACPIDPHIGLAILSLTFGLVLITFFIEYILSLSGMAMMLAVPFAIACALSLFAVFICGCVVGLVIIESTSLQTKGINSWPEGGFMEWIFHSIFVLNALAFCGIITFPIDWIASFAIPSGTAFETKYGPVSLFAVIYPFVMFVFFPIFLLSMLESASRFMPYSQFILTSLKQIPGTWLKFYGISFGLYLVVSLIFWCAAQMEPNRLVNSLLILIAVTAWMIYFRLLGRMGWLIGEKVEIIDEEPVENEPENASETKEDLLGDPASPSVV